MNGFGKEISQRLNIDKPTLITSWIAIVGLFALLLWVYFAELDVFSSAVGKVVPASSIKQIQHLEGGIIGEIHVVEGQKVSAEQVLITLEPTRNQADVDELTLKIAALETDIHRLAAETSLAEKLVFDEQFELEHKELVDKSKLLFDIRRKKTIAEMDVQTKLIAQRQQNLEEITARRLKSEDVLSVIKEQQTISAKLLELNLGERMKHLELIKQIAEIEGDLAIFEASEKRASAAIDEANAKLVSIKTDTIESAQSEKDALSRSFAELSERLVRYKDSLTRTIVRAPVDGIVKTISIATEGGVVRPGSTIMEIVPTGDRLVIEAQLATQDIGYVQIGSEAQLRLASADAQRFEKLLGRVSHISADTLINENGSAYYKIRVETEEAFFRDGLEQFHLHPGMQIQSNIRTGSRTLMQYLVSPFINSADQALHER